MKIGISSAYYQRWGEDRYNKVKEHGFSHIDFDMINTEMPPYSCDNQEFKSRLLAEKELINKAGIGISQVHGAWRWPPRDDAPKDRAERMDQMKRSIQGTALLGCKNWVIHPIMPFGINDKGTKDEEKTWEMNLNFMRELLKTAKEHDVTICLENMPMPGFSIGLPTDILRFVKMIDDHHFKICLDTGHAAICKDLSPADAMRKLGSQIRVLHIHDNKGTADEHLIPYFGIIDWMDFGRALKECEFEGVFSYETGPPKKLPAPIFEEMCILLVRLAKEVITIS